MNLPNLLHEMRFEKNKVRGFTLIELMVVIAIIALLSSIVLASLATAKQKAQDSVKSEEVKSLVNALEEYAGSNGGYYPMNVGGSVYATAGNTAESCIEFNAQGSGGGLCMWGSGWSKSDPALYTTLGQYMNLPLSGSDSVVDDDGTQWGGIGYMCLVDTNPGGSPDNCKEYVIEWISTNRGSRCDGGIDVDKYPIVGNSSIAGTSNTYCLYTNATVSDINAYFFGYWY